MVSNKEERPESASSCPAKTQKTSRSGRNSNQRRRYLREADGFTDWRRRGTCATFEGIESGNSETQ